MKEIKEIKIPKGVESISVTQHDDKIVIEFIPDEPKFKRGDILKSTITPELTVIFDKMTSITEFDSIYDNWEVSNHGWRLECFRHATEKEKQKFFDELKADGKRWSAEKIIVEDIPLPVEEPKNGDLAIFWQFDKTRAVVRLFDNEQGDVFQTTVYVDNTGNWWANAIKFESKEQFEKILRGKI